MKLYLLGTSGFRSLSRSGFLFNFITALFDLLVDVIRYLGSHGLIDDQLVKRCNLSSTVGTQEVML